MPKPCPLPPDLPAAFAVGEALLLGVSRDRLRTRDLESVFRGSRSRPVELKQMNEHERRFAELLAKCAAYVPVAPRDFAFSHVTAARLYRIPLPASLERRAAVDVATSGAVQPRMRGVIGHRIALGATRVIHGFNVVSPEDAWLQLATMLTVDELVVAGDHLVKRKRPLTNIESVRAAAQGSSGRRGIATARSALADIRSGTDSPGETRTRLVIVRAGLPEPVVGHEVVDADGYFVGTPDLAYILEKIAIEYEGEVHRIDQRTFDDDIDRRERFEAAGWRVIRVRARHLRDPHALTERVRAALHQRGTSL